MMMVQLANPNRLSKVIEFGTIETTQNQNGMPVETFKAVFKTRGGVWTRTQNQKYQVLGTDLEHTVIYITRHRQNWDGTIQARVNHKVYQVIDVDFDSQNLPTSYDLITLSEVNKHG